MFNFKVTFIAAALGMASLLPLPAGAQLGDYLVITAKLEPIDADGFTKITGTKVHFEGAKLPEQPCEVAGIKVGCADIARAVVNAIVTTREIGWSVQPGMVSSLLLPALIKDGWLVENAAESNGQYAAQEREAREAKRGIWALLARQ